MTIEDDLAYKYAWNWFDFHAKQRMTTFYFFLVILGALGYAYIQLHGRECIPSWICFSIGLSGAIVSFAFLMLEVRNTILVDDGREALDILEKGAPLNIFNIRKNDLIRFGKIKHLDGDIGWVKRASYVFTTHTLWLRSIICAAIFASLLASFYAINCLNTIAIVVLAIICLIIFITSIWNRVVAVIFPICNICKKM